MPSKRRRRRLRKLTAAVGAPSGPAVSSSRRILEPFLDDELAGGGGDDEATVLREGLGGCDVSQLLSLKRDRKVLDVERGRTVRVLHSAVSVNTKPSEKRRQQAAGL